MRLVKYVLTKENNFANAFKTNYMREKRVIDKKYRVNAMIMDKQKEFYHTNLVSCECGETKLISRMMRIEIPCSHIYSMKKKFEEIPENIKLVISKDDNGLYLNYEVTEIPDVFADSDITKKLQNKAVKTIRRFSHFKQDKVIQEEVSRLQINEEFANGVPTSYHEFVAAGISKHFIRKNKSNETTVIPPKDNGTSN